MSPLLLLAQVQEPGAMDDTLPDELGKKMEVLLAKRKPHRNHYTRLSF